ncbi:hypothetical protein Pcinc_014165 [Petrolisthes cinctipes]|uniref:Uncharacterized protein n=1 Tax=Petrolisthes cinctipes TaxID=88211 RepID=A0AAE1FX07_PETCI|nr:hypothetical protein Pcinc_014165 [Petrolisthes cinctipes]
MAASLLSLRSHSLDTTCQGGQWSSTSAFIRRYLATQDYGWQHLVKKTPIFNDSPSVWFDIYIFSYNSSIGTVSMFLLSGFFLVHLHMVRSTGIHEVATKNGILKNQKSFFGGAEWMPVIGTLP